MSPNALEEAPLGGTETAILRSARAFAARGHKIVLYCNCPVAVVTSGISFVPLAQCEDSLEAETFDVFISLREVLVLTAPIRSRLFLLFSQDAHDQFLLAGAFAVRLEVEGRSELVSFFPLRFFRPFYDLVLTVGSWQAQTFSVNLGLLPEDIAIIPNGVDPTSIPPWRSFAQREKRLVYSSTPFRGLDRLLDLFPLIREQDPTIELFVFSGMQVYGHSDAENMALYDAIYQKAQQPGVVLRGSVPQPLLLAEESRALVLSYPSSYAETFCIAVLEAQACGLVPVTTSLGALPERIKDGRTGLLVGHSISDTEVRGQFVRACVDLCNNEARWSAISQSAHSHVLEQYTYDKVVDAYLALFEDLRIQERPATTREMFPTFLAPGKFSGRSESGTHVNMTATQEDLIAVYKDSLQQLGFQRWAAAFG